VRSSLGRRRRVRNVLRPILQEVVGILKNEKS